VSRHRLWPLRPWHGLCGTRLRQPVLARPRGRPQNRIIALKWARRGMSAVRQDIARVWARTCAYARWMTPPWFVRGTAAVLIIALGVAFFPPITERRMRFAGLALQVLGTGFGFLALMETRQLFRLPSFADSAREWIKRRPRSQVVVPLTGTAVMTSAGSAKLSLWSNMGPELDTAQRINALVVNV
jgi:hypothetical protein